MTDQDKDTYSNIQLESQKDQRDRHRKNEQRREQAFARILSIGSWSFGLFLVTFFLSFLLLFGEPNKTNNFWHISIFPAMMGMMTIATLIIASKMVYVSKTDEEHGKNNSQDNSSYISPISKAVDAAQDKL